MKDELSSFAIETLRRTGFAGRGRTIRVVGEDLQWVAQVEKVGHVDQVNIEIGLVFRPAPLMKRNDCRVLWSLPDFVGVESNEVARALLGSSDYEISQRQQIVGDAITTTAAYVRTHTTITSIRDAYERGELDKAFVFKDARELLEQRTS